MERGTTLRRLCARLDALHSFVYVRPESGRRYGALGYEGLDAYFAARAAPMGAVGPETVVATFFNYSPRTVHRSVPRIWTIASPAQVLEVRLRVADEALRNMLGDAVDGAEVARAAALLRPVAEGGVAPGRPLFAANAGLAWPEEPHLQLFHAVTLIREFRGDAHVAALVLSELDPVEALVLDVVAGSARLPGGLLRATRGWTDEEWARGFVGLRERGLVGGDEALNDDGLALREQLERQTDDASLGPWVALDDAELDEVVALTRPLVETIRPRLLG